ncbi:DUF2813 domain-containing protein [Mesorhizobium sp. M3A.F.Ca.ET.174.01.1.1]|uniref:ATP-dependent nuclease n=1 Tax=unclassified Mesorhizobium TaxID=325217 RepID=UPI001093CDE9|nr:MULTISPECIES: AAA family ATPase [unclassified Mesorhizobium]TGS82734.1 DUF2813 domain-containing protein [Mesorhizobium sp. M3A.F.Ca.ET.175.01.1.1]TGT22689.1 DUF2813 domain-containing protein [Mesorhizobium sp. M3A.F.Ca.ET.174.01.1.1]
MSTTTVSFRLSEIQLYDFRGADRLKVEFPLMQPLYLVGANNAGKSTVLDAIALALKGGGFHTFSPDGYDFHHGADSGRAEEFHIYLRFEADRGKLPAVQGMGSPAFVHGVHVQGRITRKGPEHSHYLIDDAGKTISFSRTTPVKGEAKDAFAGTGVGFRPVNARLDDIRDFLPEVWVLRPNQIDASLYEWKTGPLRRLATLLSKRFLEADWNFNWRGGTRSMPAGIQHAHQFLTDAVREFPFWKDDLRPKLEKALGHYLGDRSSFALTPDLASIEEWLVQQLTVAFAVEANAPSIPISRMGDGVQSLVRLAALDVISQYPEMMRNERVVILFEEPETHLHPHLRRKLRVTLEQLAERGYQIVVTTHSSEFISFADKQRIARLSRTPDGVRLHPLLPSNIKQEIKQQERLERGRATLEIPFSRRVLMSEGKTDELAFRLAFAALGFDADGCSLAIVRADGAAGLPPLAELTRAFGLPWFAVIDDDLLPDGTKKPATDKATLELEKLRTEVDRVQQMKGALEGALNLSRHGDSAEVYNRLKGISEEVMRREYAAFAALCDNVRNWCLATSS